MRRFLTAWVLIAGFALASCTTATVEKIQSWSANYQTSVAAINADIAATAPTVMKACGDLQTVATLIRPFVLAAAKGKSQQYFDAANGALTGYCQTPPTDIASTARAVAAAYASALAGYKQLQATGG